MYISEDLCLFEQRVVTKGGMRTSVVKVGMLHFSGVQWIAVLGWNNYFLNTAALTKGRTDRKHRKVNCTELSVQQSVVLSVASDKCQYPTQWFAMTNSQWGLVPCKTLALNCDVLDKVQALQGHLGWDLSLNLPANFCVTKVTFETHFIEKP